MSDEAPETFTMTLAGREIMFRMPALGQVLVLRRVAMRRIKESGGDQMAPITELARTLDLIQGLIVSPQDSQFVEDQMLEGNIDWTELMPALNGGRQETQVADDEEPVRPVKRAPRKSPKGASVDLADKKPAQVIAKPAKTATRGRAKR